MFESELNTKENSFSLDSSNDEISNPFLTSSPIKSIDIEYSKKTLPNGINQSLTSDSMDYNSIHLSKNKELISSNNLTTSDLKQCGSAAILNNLKLEEAVDSIVPFAESVNEKNVDEDITTNQNMKITENKLVDKRDVNDLDLLAKLEEANRVLEADRKSLRCLSPVPQKKLSTESLASANSLEETNNTKFEQDATNNEKEQIEIKKLRTENKLFRNRIKDLEAESQALADRLLNNQIKEADKSEKVHELQEIILQQHHVLEEVDVDVLRHRVRDLTTANQNNQMIIESLRTKTSQLEQMNESLTHEPSMDVLQLEEQLAFCKLREAEAHMTSKDLERKVNELDRYWQKHMELTNEATKEGKLHKSKLERVSEELLSSNLREASLLNQLNEYKAKITEFESKNNVNERHIKKLEASNSEFQEKILSLESEIDKNQQEEIALTRQISTLQTKMQEEELMVRFKDAENSHLIAELRQRIAHLEIKNEELLTAEKLSDGNNFQKSGAENIDVQLSKLQIEMVRLKRLKKAMTNGHLRISFTSDDDQSDDEEEDYHGNKSAEKDILTLSSIMSSGALNGVESGTGRSLDDCLSPSVCSKNGSESIIKVDGVIPEGSSIEGNGIMVGPSVEYDPKDTSEGIDEEKCNGQLKRENGVVTSNHLSSDAIKKKKVPTATLR